MARYIRQRRIDRRETGTAIAAMVGVSRWTYSGWESGKTSVPVDLLPPLADALGLSVRELAEVVAFPDAEERLRLARLVA